MEYKKILTATICTTSSFLTADQTPLTVTAPPPPTAYGPSGVTTQPRGVITPAVAPRVQNGMDLVIDADFTWWKSQLSGMGFANINGKKRTPASNYEPGFKLGAGLDLGFDGWDGYAEYTWVNQPWQTNSFSARGGSNFSTFAEPDDSGTLSVMPLDYAESSRELQFNIIDAEMGRNFFISKRLTLRPHFGLKACRMFEKTTITERGVDTTTKSNLFFKQTLSGIGIRGGLNTVWHMTKTFGFYGDIAVSTLWSAFYNKTTSKIISDGSSTNNATKSKVQSILPIIETGLGLTYMTWFDKEHYQFYAKAGWEQQAWIDYNQNTMIGISNTSGTLSIQGVTVKAGFAF